MKSIPLMGQNMPKTIPFRSEHKYTTIYRECPPPGPCPSMGVPAPGVLLTAEYIDTRERSDIFSVKSHFNHRS